jgi:hypothetical protein
MHVGALYLLHIHDINTRQYKFGVLGPRPGSLPQQAYTAQAQAPGLHYGPPALLPPAAGLPFRFPVHPNLCFSTSSE